MKERLCFQHLGLLSGSHQSVYISPCSDCCAHHLLKLQLTYNYLTNVDTPAMHLPATSSTSRFQCSMEAQPAIYFDKPAIACLMNPKAMLNDTFMNEGLQLLLFYCQPNHIDRCSTYTMTYIKQEADNKTLQCDVCHHMYWEKSVWIIPINLQHPYLHWMLCIINIDTATIQLFDSLTDRSLWMDDVKASGIIDIYTPSHLPSTLQNALTFIAHMQSWWPYMI